MICLNVHISAMGHSTCACHLAIRTKAAPRRPVHEDDGSATTTDSTHVAYIANKIPNNPIVYSSMLDKTLLLPTKSMVEMYSPTFIQKEQHRLDCQKAKKMAPSSDGSPMLLAVIKQCVQISVSEHFFSFLCNTFYYLEIFLLSSCCCSCSCILEIDSGQATTSASPPLFYNNTLDYRQPHREKAFV